MARHIPRFFVKNFSDLALEKDSVVQITSQQMHHAVNVLRLKKDDEVKIFNAKIGEWICCIFDIKKNLVKCLQQIKKAAIATENDHDSEVTEKAEIIAVLPLINPTKMSIMLEKITELGISTIIPIISQYTQQQKFNKEKAEQIIIGACEQCGRIDLPKLFEVQKLKKFLDNYSYDCSLIVGDESLRFEKTYFEKSDSNQYAFLIGPEGGFSEEEQKMFDSYKFIKKISLGENILRSETAAIALTSIIRLLLIKQ